MPILSISWPELKSRLDGSTVLLALTNRQVSMLLTLSEQLTWEKTFRTSDYDWSDKDALDWEVADLQRQLMSPVNLDDYLQYIDEVETLLQALVNHAQSVPPCCGEVDFTNGDQYTDPVTDGSGNVPQNIIDAGYATDAADWAGFDDYKCMISHVMVDSMELSLRQMIDLFGSSGEIIGGIGSVSAVAGTLLATTGVLAVGIIGAVGAVAGLMTAIVGLGEVATEALADGIAANHDELACAIYTADGSEGAVTALKDKIDELFSVFNAALLKNMSLDASLKALYAGRYDQQDIADNLVNAGYDPANFTCDCQVIPDGEIYGIGFTVTRFNSEHGNGALWNVDDEGSNGGILELGSHQLFTRITVGGGEVQGVDLPAPKQVVIGNAAALADITADIEHQHSIRAHGSRSGDYWRINANNDNVSPAKWCEAEISSFICWVSNDGGATGVWANATVTENTLEGGWSLAGDNLSFYKSAVGFSDQCTLNIVKGGTL